jgi:hypothetical protein
VRRHPATISSRRSSPSLNSGPFQASRMRLSPPRAMSQKSEINPNEGAVSVS